MRRCIGLATFLSLTSEPCAFSREPERYRAEFGDAAYDVMLGDCRWQVYRTMGKLGARIDVLRKG